MTAEWKIVWSIATVSWLLSLYLVYRLWRGPGFPALKVGLTVVLAAPVLGPFFYVWIMGIPEPNADDKMDVYRLGDFHDRWRARLEKAGKLPRLVPRWNRKLARKGRHKPD
jgi:hypothetical protein